MFSNLMEIQMKNSIIIPEKFEKIFMIEASKEGLISHIDIGEDYTEYDEWEKELYSRYHQTRQKVFQMLLLYDEIIFPDFDPTYEYDNLKNKANFFIYSLEDFLQYDPIHEEGHMEFSEYIKPAVLSNIIKELKKYIVIKDENISFKSIASEIYDITLGRSKKISNKIEGILETNKFMFDLQHQQYFKIMDKLHAPSVINKNRFYTDLAQLVISSYERLCWQLEISSNRDAYIINCDYQLSKIGCDDYKKDINLYLDSYKILKYECSKIIGNLPKMNSLKDVFELKEKRKNDIKNLKDVLEQLEYTLKNEGKEQTIIKASNEVKKASNALNKRNELAFVGKWTTLFSVPVSLVEMLCGLPPIGLSLSVIGTGSCIVDEIIKRKNAWCEIVR